MILRRKNVIIVVMYLVEHWPYRVRISRHTFAVADILFIYVNYHITKCSNVSVRMLKYASFLPL